MNVDMKYFRILLSLLIYIAPLVTADFDYIDFNETHGLIFLGDAGTTVCYDDPLLRYGDVQGKADVFDEGGSEIERFESTDLILEGSTSTNVASDNQEIEQYLAGFLHRGDTISASTKCRGRVRLTPSGSGKTGAVWYRDPVLVNNGFDSYFYFQISDHSKVCTTFKDQYFSQFHHRTCSVHGGDGFAFVIQNDPNATDVIGRNGGQIGFGGIQNSLAIAFDTWQNPGFDSMHKDHVSIISRGKDANDALAADSLLGIPRVTELADGQVHRARIVYFKDLRVEYLDQLVASASLFPYLLDNGEQKRIGTLVVFVDEGIDTETPLLAMPINLSLLLDLPSDKAYIGFTSSTGRFFEKHDLLGWKFCDNEPCPDHELDKFDYHHTDKFYPKTRLRASVQGPGYGGGDNSRFPSRHISPDTSPWEEPVSSFSSGRNHGLSDVGELQVPPDTLY